MAEKTGDQTNGPSKPLSHKDTFTFDVLHLIKDAQSQHGLKHGDYQRYRQYCARKIARLRKSINFMQGFGPRGRTYTVKKVTPEVVEDALANQRTQKDKKSKDPIRFLHIVLFESERCWAHAMQLKQEIPSEKRKRFHMVRRFRRAVKHANELEELCVNLERADARSRLEVQAYAAYITGMYHFEYEQWKESAEALKKAQTIYGKLINTFGDEETAAPYRSRFEELKPSLRYCAFNLGENVDMSSLKSDSVPDDESISSHFDELVSLAREKQSVMLNEISWLGKTIAVRQEKVRAFLLLSQELQSSTGPVRINQIEKALFECNISINLLKEQNMERTPLFCYLLYLRHQLTIDRNLKVIRSQTNPIDLLRPYEMITHCLTEMSNLPLDSLFVGCEDQIEKFRLENEGKILAYKAFRCYYIGKIDKNSWQESVALLDRAHFLCSQAMEHPSVPQQLKDQLHQVHMKADAEKYSIYAKSLMRDEGDVDESSTDKQASKSNISKPLSERLDEYLVDEGLANKPNLFKLPPDFKSIPCKPLFFDLALNSIEYPNLDDEKNAGRTAPGGLTGLVKGWMGWSK